MRIPYDVPKVHLYTRIRKSPYFPASRRHGVQSYSVANRMYHPRHYDDPIAEYWRLVNDVTLWDVGVERQVEIAGPDALEFTNLLTPRDVTTCSVGQCRFVLVTDHDGGIVNNPVLLRPEEDRFWLSVADGDVLLWAKGIAAVSDYDVTVREPDVAPVQIQGPKSKTLMTDLIGEQVLDLAYYQMGSYELDGMRVIVSRTGYSGEVGYEIYLHDASRDAVRLWETVLEVGANHDLAVIGPSQIRRVEAGILSYGSEIALDNSSYSDYAFLNPWEAGLEWTVDLDQDSDFIGREALESVAADGPSRRIVGVELDGDPLVGYIEDHLPVVEDGDRIGHVSSAFWSPRLAGNIGFALVPIDRADLDTKLDVSTAIGQRTATVVPTPFIDPTKDIPKQ